jgi:lysophospholipase L1-like esterase
MMLIALAGLALTQDMVATKPADRLGEPWWKARHEACLKISKCRVAFLGDSITQGWEGTGKAVWDRDFAPLGAANFGFSGDRTEHVLWRFNQGELLPLKPEVVVIMIGTNNIGHGSSNAEQTATGVRGIVKRIRTESPDSKILLLGIFPRGRSATDPMRMKVADATSQFKSLADDKHVWFKDIGFAFTYRNGDLKTTIMPDLLHLSPGGYELWSKAILPDVKRLLDSK